MSFYAAMLLNIPLNILITEFQSYRLSVWNQEISQIFDFVFFFTVNTLCWSFHNWLSPVIHNAA